MRYSIKPRDRIYVKGYGFSSFAKNIGKYLSNKNYLIVLKIYNRCNKNSIENSNSKIAEETGDLIGNKIADKITSRSKKPVKELPNNDE